MKIKTKNRLALVAVPLLITLLVGVFWGFNHLGSSIGEKDKTHYIEVVAKLDNLEKSDESVASLRAMVDNLSFALKSGKVTSSVLGKDKFLKPIVKTMWLQDYRLRIDALEISRLVVDIEKLSKLADVTSSNCELASNKLQRLRFLSASLADCQPYYFTDSEGAMVSIATTQVESLKRLYKWGASK